MSEEKTDEKATSKEIPVSKTATGKEGPGFMVKLNNLVSKYTVPEVGIPALIGVLLLFVIVLVSVIAVQVDSEGIVKHTLNLTIVLALFYILYAGLSRKMVYKQAMIVSAVIGIALGVVHYATDVETLTYILAVIVVISLVFHLISGTFLMITVRANSEPIIQKKPKLADWETQRKAGIIATLIIGAILIALGIKFYDSFGWIIFSGAMIVAYGVFWIVDKFKKFWGERSYPMIAVLTACWVVGSIVIGSFLHSAWSAYKSEPGLGELIFSLIVMAIAWGWCATRMIGKIAKVEKLEKETVALLLLGFALCAIAFYQWLNVELGSADARKWMNVLKSSLQVLGVVLGIYLVYYTMEKESSSMKKAVTAAVPKATAKVKTGSDEPKPEMEEKTT